MMEIQVRLAEPFWRVVGQRNLVLQLAEAAQVADLLAHLCRQYPAFAAELEAAPPMIFVGDDEVTTETPLAAGDAVHLVWPIAGG